uniref:probable dolichyl-diphosphooligosaccharide--protein glycosyltransferase subunit 3B n=1 Tax=Erigeron canadensis TaxID=72917 RepID=UPI001CB99D48|nr:probable dolichyl-diphosphooligosaccharide--protein glycosyltransferase subunit 3B [Erigeron canadensis]
MAISSKRTHLLLLLLTFLCLSFIGRGDIVSDLHSLRSQSPSGIIHLNETLLNRIFTLSENPRSFYLIIFFDAIQLHNQPEPNLKSIKSEFALVSKSFIINNKNSSSSLFRIFFCDIEFSESEKEFIKFGVEVLPNIRIVPPDVNDSKSDSIPMDLVDHSSLAQSISDFIYSKTGLLVGKIHYPPIFTKIQLGFLVLGILLWMPFMIRKLILGETIFHNKKIWMFGTYFVYFFSVSGSMFILIRRIPLFVIDRKDPSKVVFFFNGNGMQFGAEGMCVGFLFTIVGFLLAFVTRVVVRIKDSMIQRVAMISVMIVSFWAVREVVRLSHWKTGYIVHAYLPSNWYK